MAYEMPVVSFIHIDSHARNGDRNSSLTHYPPLTGYEERSHRSHPILRFTTCEETISYLSNNLLSPILNNPCMTAHPGTENTLYFIESELIPDFVIVSSISSLELHSRLFKTAFNIPKNQKSQGLMSGE
jgi:hypothetical protein